MRLVAALMVTSMAITAAEIKIDHVTVAGASLERLRAGLASAGIESEYGGPHANGGTEMALVSFPDGSYLELIAVRKDADPKAIDSHAWSRFLRVEAAPCAWAASLADLAPEIARLRAAGVRVSEPHRSGRARPDGVRLEWETVQVGDSQGGLFPFLIRDFTPRRDRAFPSGKASNKDFGGLSRIVIAVRNLENAVKLYRQAYGLPAPLKQVDKSFEAHLAVMGGTPLILAAPLTADSWIAGHIEQFGEGPCAFVLSARRPGRYRPASHTRWFAGDFSWFDQEKLGWRLGFE
jgi:hypothetical protein